jgi:hypothetical protein
MKNLNVVNLFLTFLHNQLAQRITRRRTPSTVVLGKYGSPGKMAVRLI